MKKWIFSLTLLGMFLLGLGALGHADVGNFNSYSGGYHRSGGISFSGGRSSHGFSVGGRKTFHYSKREGLRDTETGEPMNTFDAIMLVVLLGFGVCVVIMKLLCGPSYSGIRMVEADNAVGDIAMRTNLTPLPNHNEEIALALSETDLHFNLYDFLTWTKEVFMKLQLAWMKRDWESVRTFESDRLFVQHEAQLKEYERLGRINMLDRININNAYLFLFRQEKTVEYVAVFMQARMIDYIIDEHSGAVLKGSADKDCFFSYLYIFKRARGITTPEEGVQAESISCPHCGAPIRVGSSGRCEYCDFVVLVKNHGWVLDDIIGVKPPYSTYGPGGVRRYKNNGGNTYGTHSGH